LAPELRRCRGPDGRAVTGADHGNDRAVGKFEPAFGIKERRRRIDMGERVRIALLP
jgi:hypothetical protein